MKYSNIFKVVIMEDCKTSSCVWTQFIKAKNNAEIEKWISHSDCKIIYIARLDAVDAKYTDKAIDELVNGEMIYHSR